MTRFFLMVTVLFAATGCAAITDPLGMEDPFAIPQPFHGVARNDAMLAQAIEVPALVVDTPQGLSDEHAVALRNQIVLAARKHDVPASAEPMVRAWVLSAQAATISNPGKKGMPVETSVLSWRVIDAEGTERAQFVVSFDGNESSLTDAGIQLVAEQTASALDAALARPATQVAQVATATAEKPIAWIGSIKGAPGDGNAALARALQGVLPLKGVRVEAKKDKAQWRIEGQVKVEQASPTQDKVTLTWRVLDAKGKEAGTIKQENGVPHGRLNKPWAEIAGFAAEAAAEGIAQLIQQVTKPKPA